MKCTATMKTPVKSAKLERTNSNHQFDYDSFDYVWRNGVKVPIVDEFWLGGCNYAKGIVFYGDGPHNRCFYYKGIPMASECLKIYYSEVDDRYWCTYDDGSKEFLRNHGCGVEVDDDNTADIQMDRQEWIQPRIVYRATKVLRNPEACLHESISENDCRPVKEEPEAPAGITLSPTTTVDPVAYKRSCGCNK